MIKKLKSIFLITLITTLLWIIIDFFIGRTLLNLIKYANNHGTVHPHYHHTFLPNVDKILNWGNEDFRFCTDNHGFRNSCNSKNENEKYFDIAFIGDSVTEGVGLNFEDTIVGYVSKELKNKKIANLAASSYSTIIYNNKLKFLINNGYKFKEVFILIDPSDIQDDSEVYKISKNTVLSKNRTINKYNFLVDKTKYFLKNTVPISYEIILNIKKLNSGQKNNLGNRGKNISKKDIMTNVLKISASNNINKNSEEFKNIDLRRLAWTYDKNISYGNLLLEESIKISIEQIEQLYNFLNSKNIPLSIIVYPLPPHLAFDIENSLQVKIWKDFCYSKCKLFINTFPFFFEQVSKKSYKEINDKFFIKNDIHFNKNGNQAIANLILMGIRK